MIQQELNAIIEKHQHWLKEDCDGWKDMKANLHGANLSGADLSRADLSRANLEEKERWAHGDTCKEGDNEKAQS